MMLIKRYRLSMVLLFWGNVMILRIESVKPLKNYILSVTFDEGYECLYNVGDDIDTIENYEDLKYVPGLFE